MKNNQIKRQNNGQFMLATVHTTDEKKGEEKNSEKAHKRTK